MRLLPGALACVGCDEPVAATGAESTPEGSPPPYALPPPPAYGAPPPQYGAPPPPYGAPSPPYGPPPAYVGPVPYSPGYYPTGPTPWSTNGMSVASLVLSLLWLGGIGSLLGVIFGHVSRRSIKQRPQRGEGLALAGLIIGYIGLVGAVVFWASLPRIIDSGLVQDVIVQQDIRDAATAEDSYLHDYNQFSTDGSYLRAEGFTPLGHNTIAVAISGSVGYCIVGAHDNSNTWYLYDSNSSGLSSATYPSESLAESACTVDGIGLFEPIN